VPVSGLSDNIVYFGSQHLFTMHKALQLSAPHGRLSISFVRRPSLQNGEVLIKNVTGALNPIDWKQVAFNFFIPSYPSVLGLDIAGVVDEVASDVTHVKKGDKVQCQLTNLSSGMG
jgi:NADPH:quinone reductase-like Zn-dependent oxidoreductase